MTIAKKGSHERPVSMLGRTAKGRCHYDVGSAVGALGVNSLRAGFGIYGDK